MRASYIITSLLLVALGVIHVALTSVFFDALTVRALWFVSGGLMIVFLGFLNILCWKVDRKDSVVFALCLIANLIANAFTFLYVMVDGDRRNYVIVVLFLYLTVACRLSRRKRLEERGVVGP